MNALTLIKKCERMIHQFRQTNEYLIFESVEINYIRVENENYIFTFLWMTHHTNLENSQHVEIALSDQETLFN